MRIPTLALLVCSALAPLTQADDKAAIEKLKEAKVEVKLDKAGNPVGVFCKESQNLTADHFRLIGSLKSLKELTLYRCPITDEGLALLTDLPNLEKVAFEGGKFTDDGMKQMAGWKSLKTMTFFHSLNKEGFTGAGVAHLKELPNFESFGCGGSSLTDAGLAAIASLPHLKDLRIWHTMNTDAGTVKLQACKNLRSVWLAPQFTPRITDASLLALSEIPSLEQIKITETRLTWDGGLKHLQKLPNLRKLTLDETEISDADLAKVKEAFPKVELSHKPPTEQQLKWLKDRFAKAKK